MIETWQIFDLLPIIEGQLGAIYFGNFLPSLEFAAGMIFCAQWAMSHFDLFQNMYTMYILFDAGFHL